MPHRPARQGGFAPLERMGGRNRTGHTWFGRTGPAAGGPALGPRRSQPGPAVGRFPDSRVDTPEPTVGSPRLLRLPSVLRGQRRHRRAGRRTLGLATALTAFVTTPVQDMVLC